MRLFYQRTPSSTLPFSFVDQVIENDDKTLSISVFGRESAKQMEEFLAFIKVELQFAEYHIENAFEHTKNGNTYIINSKDENVKAHIMEFFSANDLIPPQQENKPTP